MAVDSGNGGGGGGDGGGEGKRGGVGTTAKRTGEEKALHKPNMCDISKNKGINEKSKRKS